MKWYKKLWIGKKAVRKKDKIIRDIKENNPVLGGYIIILAQNTQNIFDIVPLRKTKWLYEDDYYIVGIAFGKKEAFDIVRQIVDYIYVKEGKTNIREYFSKEMFS